MTVDPLAVVVVVVAVPAVTFIWPSRERCTLDFEVAVADGNVGMVLAL